MKSEALPRVALCISGLLRSLPYADIADNIHWALVRPLLSPVLDVDSFLAISLDASEQSNAHLHSNHVPR